MEKISIQEDSAKISSLEKAIKTVEQENKKIINNFEYKKYLEKRKRNERNEDFLLLGLIGPLLAFFPICYFRNKSLIKQLNKDIKALE